MQNCIFDQLSEKLHQFKIDSKFFADNNVLSAIFLQKNELLTLVSFGVGTSCLNSKDLLSSDTESLVKDMHAEVLAKQSFLRWLMFESQNEESTFVSLSKSGKYKLDAKIVMYISQAPCGDCSIDQIRETKPEFEHLSLSKCQDIVLHGHSALSLQGRVRTKPGRFDSVHTPILSCSDKMANWIHLDEFGMVQKYQLYHEFEPTHPSTLIISNLFNYNSIVRGLFYRFNVSIPDTFQLLHLPISFLSSSHQQFSCWWNAYDSIEFLANNGLKLGASIKNSHNEKVHSKICSKSIKKLRNEIFRLHKA